MSGWTDRLRAWWARLRPDAPTLPGPPLDDEFEPDEFGDIVDDDAVIDALGAGTYVDDDEVTRLLSHWRRDVDAEPLPEFPEPERWYPDDDDER